MGKKHTILQVIPQLDLGGAEKNAVDCALGVAQYGWRSLLASRGGKMVARAENGGCEHFKMPLDGKNPIVIFKNARRIEALIKQHGIDLIHVHSRSPAWSVKLAANRTKTPFVTTYHGAYGQKNAIKRWYNRVMVMGAAVIANSHWTADLIKSRYRNEGLRIEVIEPGTDFTQFDLEKISQEQRQALLLKWGVKDYDHLVLYLGRLSNPKGAHILIEAAQSLLQSHPKTMVIIAGSAAKHQEYVENLKADIKAFEGFNPKFSGRIKLVGRCDQPHVALALADFLVVPSLRVETFGLSAVEAQAMGAVPIVAKIGGLMETVKGQEAGFDAQSGWHFEAGNGQALHKTLFEAFYKNDEDLQKIRARGRQSAETRYGLSNINAKLIKFYKNILG